MKTYALDSASFLEEVFAEARKKATEPPDPLCALFENEFYEISSELDKTHIQDSWSWRNVTEARLIASLVIDDTGTLNLKKVLLASKFLEARIYSLGPGREQDDPRKKHLLRILEQLSSDKELVNQLKRISKPISHPLAEKLIRDTLFLPERAPLTDADARRASLSALLTSLRQNVGSCFATAPAILVQQELPHLFLADISQLLSMGRLTRTFSGIEHTAPLSYSSGVADLNRPFYLSSFGKHPLELLSHAPGLIWACISAGMIDPNVENAEKIHILHTYLQKTPLESKQEEPFFILTPAAVIEALLKSYFGVTEEDLEQFALRPKEFIFAGLAARPSMPKTSKAHACTLYYKGMESAKAAFKALTDNALLKSWEFTLASFAETKADFARWNLHASLGLTGDSSFGIGQCFRAILEEKIKVVNQEIEEHQSNYDHIFAQAQSLEGRARSASTERDVSWIQAEYRMRRHELNRILALRDAAYDKGKKIEGMLPFLISFYHEKFKEYFQEVYDASMHDVQVGPYDDSPAGFRLLYKHGRSNTALWTMIYKPFEYIESLSSFFVATEIELSHLPETKGLEEEISELVTAAVMLIKKEEFLENSFQRLAAGYQEPLIKDPLHNLDKVGRKPWAYISGGTIVTLVSSYWSSNASPKETSKWVESETELLAFFIDTLKDLPFPVQKKYQNDPTKPLLAFSPTHAFLLQPGRSPFLESWKSDLYTYTWIKDKWVLPAEEFYHFQMLDSRMLDRIVDEIAKLIPSGYQHVFRQALGSFSYSMRSSEFREHVLRNLAYEKWANHPSRLQYFAENIDAILYSHLPLFPEYALREKLELIFQSLKEVDKKLYKTLFSYFDTLAEEMGRYKILSAKDLREIAKGLLILSLGKTKSAVPFHQKITKIMQENKLCCPAPILFADTNWVKNLFGFIVSPGTNALELWRFDLSGSSGFPMTQWKKWVNGKEQKPWGIFLAPHEYGL